MGSFIMLRKAHGQQISQYTSCPCEINPELPYCSISLKNKISTHYKQTDQGNLLNNIFFSISCSQFIAWDAHEIAQLGKVEGATENDR